MIIGKGTSKLFKNFHDYPLIKKIKKIHKSTNNGSIINKENKSTGKP